MMDGVPAIRRILPGVCRRAGIRLRLIALAGLAIVPLLGLILLDSIAERSGAVDTVRAGNLALARLASGEQSDIIVRARTMLVILQRTPGLARSPADCRALLQRIVFGDPAFSVAGVVDASGTVVCHSGTEHHERYGDQEFFRRVTGPAAPPFQLSRFKIGRVSRVPAIVGAVPLDGGMVFVSLRLSSFAVFPPDLPRSKTTLVSVVDASDGTILAREPNAGLTGAHTGEAGTMNEIRRSPQGGSFVGMSRDGILTVAGFAPLSDCEADCPVVLIGTPLAEVIAAANARLLRNLGVLFVATLTAMGGAWGFAEFSLLRPVRTIEEAARRIGAGDLAARVPAPERFGRELAALAETLNFGGAALQRNAEQARTVLDRLERSEADYRLLADNTADMIFRLDENLVRRYVSPSSRQVLGYEPDELLGRKVSGLAHPDDAVLLHSAMRAVMEGRSDATLQYRLRHKNGHYIWAEVHFQAVRDRDSGSSIGVIGVVRDLTNRREAAAAVEVSEALYRLLADNSTDLIMKVDTNFHRLYVSPSVRTVLGYGPEEYRNIPAEKIIHPDDVVAVLDEYRGLQAMEYTEPIRYRCRHKNGEYLWVEGIGRRMEDGSGFVITLRDITHRLKIEQELRLANQQLTVLASQDGLTGLANRRCFDDALSAEFYRARRSAAAMSLIMVDVDHFKRYNDTYGHPAGDACLRDVAGAIAAAIRRPADLAARYGGEELALLLPETDAQGAMTVAELVHAAVRDLATRNAGHANATVTVSVGVATINPATSGALPEMLVEMADTALYRAKDSGRDRIRQAISNLPERDERTTQQRLAG